MSGSASLEFVERFGDRTGHSDFSAAVFKTLLQ